MTAEDVKRIEGAMAKFNTCDNAGTNLSIEVNGKLGTKSFLGYCGYYHKKVDVEPTCRICLRHEKIKKKTYKRTAVKRKRISQGRLRQKQRRLEGSRYKTHNPFGQ